jgi:hypothetical protein
MTLYVCTLCGMRNCTYSGALVHETIGHNGAPVIVEKR